MHKYPICNRKWELMIYCYCGVIFVVSCSHPIFYLSTGFVLSGQLDCHLIFYLTRCMRSNVAKKEGFLEIRL